MQNAVGNWITLEAPSPLTRHRQIIIYECGIEPYAPVTIADYYFDDIEVVQIGKANTTFDSIYIATNNAAGYSEKEEETVFGDSLQNSDIGALTISSSLTSSWSRYGKGESKSILEILSQQIINDSQAFRDRLKVSILDTGNYINYGTILLYNSKYYRFENYTKDFSENRVSGDIVQINNSDATVSTTLQPLTSADGKTNDSVSQIQQGLSYWLPTGSGIYSSLNVAIGMAPTGSYNLEVYNDVWIGGDLAVVGAITSGTFSPSSIVLANGSKTATLSVDSSGNLNISLNTSNTQVASTGDFTAYASTSPPDVSWWSTMPIASGSTLGGIKVGANLSIDVSGVLSASSSYVLPTASASTLGGIKVGSKSIY